jgi:hypothetical protein
MNNGKTASEQIPRGPTKRDALGVAALFVETCELGHARGFREIVKTPGLTILVVDEEWIVRVNPHGSTIDGVPARSCLAEFNGIAAGIYNAGGGWIAAGAAANEETLLAALRRARAECPEA